ncbi:hypothetical protein Pfo_001508 [Paulownia fortunei]|nr:hypothetical protein Pfo_001508 [Paulownia fortunei]
MFEVIPVMFNRYVQSADTMFVRLLENVPSQTQKNRHYNTSVNILIYSTSHVYTVSLIETCQCSLFYIICNTQSCNSIELLYMEFASLLRALNKLYFYEFGISSEWISLFSANFNVSDKE